jgi:proteasome lid subunit RPN8/RPN11
VNVVTVRLPGSAQASIRRCAESAYPHEGCGVLIGGHEKEAVVVQEATSGHNLWAARLGDRYELDPADILAADRRARARGLDVVGFWHSHPDHPARPSQFDSDRSWVDYAYLIVSTVRDASGDLNAFSPAGEGLGLRQIVLRLEGGGS